MRVPVRYSNLLFGGLLSVVMVTVISGTVVFVTQGFSPDFPSHWFKGFATAWPVAFPTVLVVAPLVRRIVARLTAQP
jgi:hypothetical protein